MYTVYSQLDKIRAERDELI